MPPAGRRPPVRRPRTAPWPEHSGKDSCLASRVARFLDGCKNVVVSAATANVATHQLANVVVGAGVPLVEQPDGRAELARSAIAALEGVVLDEGRLHGVEGVPLGQSLDSRDLLAGVHDRQGQAGVDPPAVDEHGTGPALAVVTALLGPRQAVHFAERVEQGHTRLQTQAAGDPLTSKVTSSEPA